MYNFFGYFYRRHIKRIPHHSVLTVFEDIDLQLTHFVIEICDIEGRTYRLECACSIHSNKRRIRNFFYKNVVLIMPAEWYFKRLLKKRYYAHT